jgi:membrane-bound inhibitor of C-type lysozyme
MRPVRRRRSGPCQEERAMRIPTLAGLMIVLAGPAPATTLSIDIPDAEVTTESIVYRCGEAEVTVDYINAGSVALAVLRMGDETVVASNVISGSGARYAGRQYVWWTKGDEALLQDVMKGENSDETCRRIG